MMALVPVSILMTSLATPFVLLPQLAKCYLSHRAQSMIRKGYPFLRMASDNAYKDYWLERLNEKIRQADRTCTDINTRID